MVQRFTHSFLAEVFKTDNLKESRVVLDPFMGSGNTLLACKEYNKTGYSLDVSPLFWFISYVKTSEYHNSDFDEAIAAVDKFVTQGETVIVPALSSYERLFDNKRLTRLLMLKRAATNLGPKARELLLFALTSELIHFSQASRYGKGLRKEKNKKQENIRKILKSKLVEMKKDYSELNGNGNSRQTEVHPLLGDARDLSFIKDPLTEEKVVLPRGEIDCVITSPPYCNSADYVEMYKLEHWFLDCVKSYEEFRKLSYSTLRSHTTFDDDSIRWKHNAIEDICDALEKKELWNKKIPTMIRAYFDDVHKCLEEIKLSLRPKGTIFLLIANSSYGAIPLPTDLLLAEAAESVGLSLERITVVRSLKTSGQQWKFMDSQSRGFLRESMLVFRTN